jgi:hypothetical protein
MVDEHLCGVHRALILPQYQEKKEDRENMKEMK